MIAALLLSGFAAFVCAPAAQGADWTGLFNSDWSVGFNWSPLSAPNGDGDTAIFDPSNLTGANITTATLDTPVALGNLTFDNAGAVLAVNFTLGGDPLTFDNNGNGAVLNVTSAYGGTAEIDANITVADAGGLSISNDGTGALILGVNGNPGGQLDLGSNSLFISGSGLTTIAQDIVGSGGLTYTGTGTLTLSGVNPSIGSLAGAGNVTLGSGTTLTTGSDNTSTTFSGIISGSGNLTQIGSGTLTLTGTSTYTGNTTVDGGTLVVSGSGAAIQDTNQVTVGNVATGNLTISDGASVTSASNIVGYSAGGNGTVTVTGANSTWTLGYLDVGVYGTGNLTISDGGMITSGVGYLGYRGGSNGTVLVDGANSTWNLGSNLLTVGFSGTGNLTISDGGNVTSGSSSVGFGSGLNGTVTVEGPNSTWNLGSSTLYVGGSGAGNLTISNGGSVTSGVGYLGYGPGSNGTATVTGANSTWNLGSNYIVVGYGSAGNLTISDGGNVTSAGGGYLGNAGSGNGTVLVTGANSTWNLGSNDLVVGDAGTGNLTISNGGNVTSGAGYLGYNNGSSGIVTVTGANSTWNLGSNNSLVVGYYGTGNLTIADGGSVVTSGPGEIGYGITGCIDLSSGTVLVTGANSTWNLGSNNSLVVGNAGTGNLTIADGGEVTSGEGIVGDAGGNGTVIVGGANSTWNLGSAGLNVGFYGEGNLIIGNGGTVTSGHSFVGSFIGFEANVSVVFVDGANSTWNLGSSGLVLGYNGLGILTISDNGTVAAGSLELDHFSGSEGLVNLNSNGTLEVGGTNGISAGNGTATFNWGGGVIQVTGSDLTTGLNATLVTDTAPSMLDTNGLNATWSGMLSGNGALDKIGVGTFTLNGTNTYAGGTDVSAGTLVITSFSSAGAGNVSVADGANLTLETNAALAATTSLILVDGAQVELDFSGTDTISMFYLDGSAQAFGTWGGTGSGAQYIDPALFSGSGVLDVTPVPEPAAFGFILGGLALLAAKASIAGRKRWRK
jgi:T5SS/PEP-CTERM-associated repeat protein/autotransporter-associated beta strand protein